MVLPIAPELLLSFAIASALIILLPGPVVLFMVGRSLVHGARRTLPCLIGIGAGVTLNMTVSMLGFGALLAASADLFTALKWLGAAYLLFLAWRSWTAAATPLDLAQPATRAALGPAIAHGFLVAALNPKGIAFFSAFMPQFIDPARPFWPQALLLMGLFLVIEMVLQAGFVLLAGRLRAPLARPDRQRLLHRAGAVVMAGAALFTATLRRA